MWHSAWLQEHCGCRHGSLLTRILHNGYGGVALFEVAIRCATGSASGLWQAPMIDSEHCKTLRRFEQLRHLHELTFSCYRRKPLLTNAAWRAVLARSLQAACNTERFALAAFVCMPEHVHLLVCPLSAEAKVSRLLARTKQPVSKQIRQILEIQQSPRPNELTVVERPGKSCFRFWQEGAGFDRNVFSSAAHSPRPRMVSSLRNSNRACPISKALAEPVAH